jgi:23S rRNA pseudouridine2604 synthase
MNIGLKGLPVGDWRDLTEQELIGIYKMIENSSSEANKPASGNKKTESKTDKPDAAKAKKAGGFTAAKKAAPKFYGSPRSNANASRGFSKGPGRNNNSSRRKG